MTTKLNAIRYTTLPLYSLEYQTIEDRQERHGYNTHHQTVPELKLEMVTRPEYLEVVESLTMRSVAALSFGSLCLCILA